MSVHRNCLLLLLTAAVSGCHSYGSLVKRDSEINCPTDIRQTVPWCAGEDAIFHCPCGPSEEFYGHKPTCWRTWPVPATVWRDSYCNGVAGCSTGSPMVVDEIPMMALPPTEEVPAPVGEAPVEALEIESAAPPSLEPLPPTTSVAKPPVQTSQRAPSREGGVHRARSGLVRRFREMPKTARETAAPAAATDVRQIGYESQASLVDAHAPSPGHVGGQVVPAVAVDGSAAYSTLHIVELPPVIDQPSVDSSRAPKRSRLAGAIARAGDVNNSEEAKPPRRAWEFVR